MNNYNYKIIVDTREKTPWIWPAKVEGHYECLGSERTKLKSGDYSLIGHEDRFIIERKATSSELYQNIFEKRFERELERLELIPYSFLIAECEYKDLVCFPINSGLPKNIWYKFEKNAKYLEQKILKYQLQFKTKWIFAGPFGNRCAEQLIHRYLKYGK